MIRPDHVSSSAVDPGDVHHEGEYFWKKKGKDKI